jgi:Ca2+-binding RTX toxin-like protein
LLGNTLYAKSSQGGENLPVWLLVSDIICGGEGNDLINGDEGADILGECEDNDTIYGGEDNDILVS